MGAFFEIPYYKELEELSKKKHRTKLITPEMRERIDSVYKEQMEKMIDVDKEFIMPFYSDGKGDFKFIKTMNGLVEKEDAIFSFNGIFKRERTFVSDILADAARDRGVYKNMSFEEKIKGNVKLEKLYDSYQKFKKEVMNSLYGCLGLPSFFLFNILTASSITGDCSMQLQTLINEIEKSYGGRVLLRNFDEVSCYLLDNMIDIDLDIQQVENFFNKLDATVFNDFDEGVLYNKLKSFCLFNLEEEMTTSEKDYLDSILKEIIETPLLKYRFFFLNDIEGFLSNSDKLRDMIFDMSDTVCNVVDKFDDKAFTKTMQVEYEPFFLGFLVDNNLQSDPNDLCVNFERTTIMMSDTDSLFVKSKSLTNLIKNTINEVSSPETRQDLDVITFRFLSFFGSSIIGYILNKLTTEIHRSGKNEIFQYKSEFYYPKMLLLPIRKTYTGLCTVQEGKKIRPFVDEKNIMKTSYTKVSTDFIMELCGDLINVEKEFSYEDTFNTIEKYSNIVKDKILKDQDSTVGTPFKYKTAGNYAAPFSESNFLAGEFHNIFNILSTLPSGSECNSLSLILPTNLLRGKNKEDETNCKLLLEYYSKFLPEEELGILSNIMCEDSTYVEMRECILKNGGIPYIGVPRGERIPDYLIPLLNIDDIVSKNIDNRSTNFLNAIGIYVDSSSRGVKVTNVINI